MHKKIHLRVVLGALLIMAISLITIASSSADQPTPAPPNPEFIAYMEKPGPVITEEGYPLGFIPSPVDMSHLAGLSIPMEQFHPPMSYDLRTQGRLTPVRNQGDCGSCWAFATMGALESWLLSAVGEKWDMSENNLKECHGFAPGPCEGGNFFMSTAYFARRSGPVSEADDPYRSYIIGCTSGLTVRKYVRDVLILPPRGDSLDNDTLKRAVMDHGAVQTSMRWEGSDYNRSNHVYYYGGSEGTNHSVAIVGWDDNKAVSGAPGNGAWIVRNSWGTGFGENGYFYVSFYDRKIGTKNAVFINAVDPDHSVLYQYDPLGWTGMVGYESSKAWAANVFKASSDGLLTSVSTYAVTVNTVYEIYIKDGLNGRVMGGQSGSFTYPGYHTIDLDSPVFVRKGSSFVVVIKYTTSGYDYPIPIERKVPGYSDKATANPGESYISSNGSSWTDLTSNDWCKTCNVCIKASVAP